MAVHPYNTSVEDRAHFSSERARFLIEAAKFKLGMIENGIAAVNTLESMYQVLLSSPHQQKDQSAAKKYVDMIAKLRTDIMSFLTRKGDREYSQEIRDPEFIALLGEFNEAVYELYRIKADLEMS